MSEEKEERLLKIFYRLLRGEEIKVSELSKEYNVTVRTIARDLELIKCMLADDRELFGNAELIYSRQNRAHYLTTDIFLKPEELLAMVEIIISSRGLEKRELLSIVEKLQSQTTCNDRKLLTKLLQKELFEYKEIKHDTRDVIGNLWRLSVAIEERNFITITYFKMNREKVKRKVCPESIIFSEYYFYLIAHDAESDITKYFRLDRITEIIVHRRKYELREVINEGELRNRLYYMWPGKKEKIKFEFTGPSVQAVLDKIPMARIIDKCGNCYTIEAEVIGDGIIFFLLSQGEWVRYWNRAHWCRK